MPIVRKLDPEEIQSLQDKGKGVRKLTKERYDRAIMAFAVGDYGELTPDPDENRLTSRNRLKAAAARRGISLTFMPTRGETMRFRVVQGNGNAKPKRKSVKRERDYQDIPTPIVPALNTQPAKKRGGRPKKQPA